METLELLLVSNMRCGVCPRVGELLATTVRIKQKTKDGGSYAGD